MGGLASRREDTPLFIAEAQVQALKILSRERDPSQLEKLLPEVIRMLHEKMSALSDREIPIEELLITQTLSRELFEYRVLSPAARAASQLQSIGKDIKMGQKIQFVYIKTQQGVYAWGLPGRLNPSWIDTAKYKELLFRAMYEVV